ncbi:fungal-trans domain-containing protein [Favolaschia claudopus]|uniref:Fungal-trans domain-containing protein n=1 Tax=Favolaschia claudopus TaxID=2862362 RepID=A0AAW0EFH3_9AGAR
MLQTGKRKRLQGSCDRCKAKKGDSIEMPNRRCSNCIAMHEECTHIRYKGYQSSLSIQGTKTPQEHVAAITSTSTVYVPSIDPAVSHRILVDVAQYARNLEEKLAALQPQTFVPIAAQSPPTSPETSPSPQTPEREIKTELPISASRHLDSSVTNAPDRFYGHSSSVQFVKAAIKYLDGNTSQVVGVQRPEFWVMQPWEKLNIEIPPQVFPPEDLMKKLIKIFFEQINPLVGILHFPSFHQSVVDGVHFRNHEFGAVILLVCALASRYSDDPRVFVDGAGEHSCGWKYFRQVRPLRATFTSEPSLYELQVICLSVIYMAGTGASPEETWILASMGVRFAQAAGAHDRNTYADKDLLTAELHRRVFWALFTTDTILSAFKGRPIIAKPSDLDVDLPLDCDEELFGTPNPTQAAAKPSASAFFPCLVRLMLIVGRIQSAVYPVNGQSCSEHTVVQLDSTLNKWVDTIPEHLRWDPQQPNLIFLDQSATLYFTYYHAQILIHRPFIPSMRKESTPSTYFPSLAICANAARSCGHVLDVQARRGRGLLHFPSLITALFDSALILLTNVWSIVGNRKPRTDDDFDRAMADAHTCIHVLRLYEKRWRLAGRKYDVLSAILKIGKESLSKMNEDDKDSTASTSASEESFSISASDTGASKRNLETWDSDARKTEHLRSLPILTEELGRLPVYHSFEYDSPYSSSERHYTPSRSTAWLHSNSELIQPNLFSNNNPTLDSVFPSPQRQQNSDGGNSRGSNLHLDPVSYNVPSNHGWQDWSSYTGALDRQRTF